MSYSIMLDSPVYAIDGQAGQIITIVINPSSSRVEYLGIQTQTSGRQLRFVPIRRIASTSGEATMLDMSLDEMTQLPTLDQQPRAAATFQSNVSDLYLAGDGTNVRSVDGALLGVFVGAVTDGLYRIERVLLAGDDAAGLPVAGIAYAEADGIAVRLSERAARA